MLTSLAYASGRQVDKSVVPRRLTTARQDLHRCQGFVSSRRPRKPTATPTGFGRGMHELGIVEGSVNGGQCDQGQLWRLSASDIEVGVGPVALQVLQVELAHCQVTDIAVNAAEPKSVPRVDMRYAYVSPRIRGAQAVP